MKRPLIERPFFVCWEGLPVASGSSNESAVNLWEPSSLAIGCAAVVNRLAHFI
jgi:hypothetical protein